MLANRPADSDFLCLKERLSRKNLQPYDVGGSGDCCFKSVSHQLFGTPDQHLQVRLAGINHLRDYPQYYIDNPGLKKV